MVQMDATNVARKLADFRQLLQQLQVLKSVDDMMSDTDTRLLQKTQMKVDREEEDDDHDDGAESKITKLTGWVDQSFVKPLRALHELSGFPSLNVAYKIHVSLAITSSSADRAMSSVQIIKNHLRTTMLDDWSLPLRKTFLITFQLTGLLTSLLISQHRNRNS
jgi:hypothetical protein